MTTTVPINFFDWWAHGLISSFCGAGFLLVNQHFKMRASTLMLWRGFGVALAYLPLAMAVLWPTNPVFYVATIATGVIVSFFDKLCIESSAKFGAGVTSRLLPLGVWLTFFMYLFVNPAHATHLLNNPASTLGILAAMAMGVGAMLFLRRDVVSRQAVLFLAPALVLAGFIDLFNKIAMGAAPDPLSGAFVYGLLMSFTIGIVTVIRRRFFEEKKVDFKQTFARGVYRGGLLVVMFIVAGMINKNIAMFFTPNPAFVGVLALSAPLWIAFYNKLTGHRDKANVWAGMLFVLSAALLVLLTR